MTGTIATMYVDVKRDARFWVVSYSGCTDYTLSAFYRGLNYVDTTMEGAIIGFSALTRHHKQAGFLGRIETRKIQYC